MMAYGDVRSSLPIGFILLGFTRDTGLATTIPRSKSNVNDIADAVITTARRLNSTINIPHRKAPKSAPSVVRLKATIGLLQQGVNA